MYVTETDRERERERERESGQNNKKIVNTDNVFTHLDDDARTNDVMNAELVSVLACLTLRKTNPERARGEIEKR